MCWAYFSSLLFENAFKKETVKKKEITKYVFIMKCKIERAKKSFIFIITNIYQNKNLS